jgi:hypothetical protein
VLPSKRLALYVASRTSLPPNSAGNAESSFGARAAAGSAKKSDQTQIRLTETPAPENLEGERKTVTMLFADIKGSMDLIEDLDPEEARAIVDPALKLMMESVQHYGGYVAQSTGDGIFALFGAPSAHEDHPQHALLAALHMQEELKRYSDRIRNRRSRSDPGTSGGEHWRSGGEIHHDRRRPYRICTRRPLDRYRGAHAGARSRRVNRGNRTDTQAL